jgi:hypothetical protein
VSEGKLADAKAKLEENQRVIVALQASKAFLQDTLQQSINQRNRHEQAGTGGI